MYDYKATYSLVLTYNLQIMHNYSHNREKAYKDVFPANVLLNILGQCSQTVKRPFVDTHICSVLPHSHHTHSHHTHTHTHTRTHTHTHKHTHLRQLLPDHQHIISLNILMCALTFVVCFGEQLGPWDFRFLG